MRVVQELRFFFGGWNFKLLLFLCLFFGVLGLLNFNVPSGKSEKHLSVVLDVGLTHSDRYGSSLASARVRLINEGIEANVILPRNVMLSPGDRLVVERQPLLIQGALYRYSEGE